MKHIISLLLTVIVLSSCGNDKKVETAANGLNAIEVQEVLQVTGYTYIKGQYDNSEIWLAGPTATLEVGKTYYFGNSMEMQNFESKELGRTFDKIYFISEISKDPQGTQKVQTQPLQSNSPSTVETPEQVAEKNEAAIEMPADGITIAELMENKEKYEGKIVKLKGKVTKYNPAIMNVNWFHVQDGTDFNGEFDLTATTKETVTMDETVTFQGKVTLNKDFGAGYFYAIIIEEATIIK